jgi:hypothetical protein
MLLRNFQVSKSKTHNLYQVLYLRMSKKSFVKW